ncbi:hypothetical protein JCM10003_1731 [Bacteroides pyogenes JCM 10003]|nr:hypothetical protein JCM10003_1731 [Bacteroides pyogenes JCM 10003]
MIHLTGINKTYYNGAPLHVLKGIDLEIGRGEFVSIMGLRAPGNRPCSIYWGYWIITIPVITA